MNKRKVLDAARKHAQKGAKQKALKEYEKLLAADPRDAKLLLEVGDAYRRWGEVEDAIGQYTKVAAQFRQDGFDARAVAVYKQILNLDSKRYETHVSLGDLYQHMGLDAEAIGALQTAADGYHKEGNKPKALELLRKMAALDPSNTTSRMKVADLLKQEGLNADAVSEYREVAAELERQGASDSVPAVLERILEIEPDSTETLAKLAQVSLDLGRADRAEPFALRLAEADPDADNLERLCTIYRSLGDDEKLATTTRSLAKLYRDRGDEDQAREIMQRLPADAVVDAGGVGSDQSELEEPRLSDDELLEDDEFLLGDEAEDLGSDDFEAQAIRDVAPPPPAPEPVEEGPPEIEVPDGDPDQLFAEASVYLRYGKVDQAIASLKGVLLQEPDHRAALEKLGEAVAEQGNEAGAVVHWKRAAEIAADEGDAAGLEGLRDRIMGLDPDVASALPTLEAAAPAPEPAAEEPPAPAADDDLEIELDLDVEADPAPEAPAPEAPVDDEAGAADDGGFELDLDDDAAFDFDETPEEEAPAQAADDGGFEIDIDADDDLAAALAEASGDVADEGEADDDVGFELAADDGGLELDAPDDDDSLELPGEGDDGIALGTDTSEVEIADDVAAELDVGVDLDVDVAPAPSAELSQSSAGEFSTTTAGQIKEQLEEAEFYLQQDLHDEAEALYRQILAIAPGHPNALLRLGEIAAAKGASPAAASEPDPSVAEEAALDIGLDDAPTDDADEPEAGMSGLDLDVDVAFDDETEESTEVAMLDAEAAARAEPTSNPLLAEEMAEAALVDEPPAIEETQPLEIETPSEATPEPVAASADDGDSFDLAAELAGAFEEANADEPTHTPDPGETASVLSKVDDGFESIFSDFKKGVSASLEEGDFETRYDLGIAYREMGLYDDAIAEFRVCLDSVNRRLESLHMMGLCALDLGRTADAVNHLEQALATPELEEGRKVGVYFDLGRAHEAAGDPGRAESVYLEVQSLDPSFPTIDERLEAVRGGGSEAPIELASEADAGLESFDDLFSDEGDEEVSAAPTESFESFDDVITAVEEEPGELDAEPVEATLEPEPEDDPPTDPGTSGRRKKKISFV